MTRMHTYVPTPRRKSKDPLFWGLGVVVAMFAIVGGAWFYMNYQSSQMFDPPPGGTVVLLPVKEGAPLSSIIGVRAVSAGDAADDIHAVVSRVRQRQADEPKFDELVLRAFKDRNWSGELPLRCADELLAAAGKSDFTYFRKYCSPEAQSYLPNDVAPFDMIVFGAISEARQAAKSDQARAEKIIASLLVLGQNMLETGPRAWFQCKGLYVQLLAAQELIALRSDDESRREEAIKYCGAVNGAHEGHNQRLAQLTMRTNKPDIGALIKVVREHPDAAWKVDALLALGMARYSKAAHKKLAPKNKHYYYDAIMAVLDEYAGNGDPWIASAAKWGLNLSDQGFRDAAQVIR